MKSLSTRIVLLSAFAIASPLITLAGGQPAKVHMPTQGEIRDRADIKLAVQAGKGTGVSRNQMVRANAWRTQTLAERAADKSVPVHPNWSDSAFRK
jgi:hypothetical protein